MTFCIVWEFRVRSQAAAAFEAAYAPDGEWARLFRRDAGYLGTELLRDGGLPGRYLTVDRWRSAAAWQAFRTRHGAAYAALDARCEPLTFAERHLGSFDAIERIPDHPTVPSHRKEPNDAT
ncbi:MAG TPA: antibiotic biosynthesis monooxygenase [Thermoanaerobaculia bacterium]|nr:antibiotic biosynthesis monooxygenase [Thermoanaerobaculia bacterium]